MRIASRRLLLLSTMLLSCSREMSKEQLAACDVLVQGTSIQYKGHPLPMPGALSDWERVLGTHSRKIEVSSDAYAWDDLGIFVGTRRGTSTLEMFAVVLRQMGGDGSGRESPAYWPRSTFMGRLCVDGSEISATSSIAQVNRYKKGEPFREGPFEHDYDYTLRDKSVKVFVSLSFSPAWTPEIFEMDFSEYKP